LNNSSVILVPSLQQQLQLQHRDASDQCLKGKKPCKGVSIEGAFDAKSKNHNG
jgi:hypothetical protein